MTTNHTTSKLYFNVVINPRRYVSVSTLVLQNFSKSAGLFPLSYAVVDSENTSNWSWFLHHLAQVVHGDRPLTFVSDRNLGLLEAMPTVFPNAEHAFCLQHLQRNLRDRLRYTNSMHRAGLVSKLRHCAYAPTVTAFNHRVEQFQKSGRSVASEFLANAHPQHWANAFFRSVPHVTQKNHMHNTFPHNVHYY